MFRTGIVVSLFLAPAVAIAQPAGSEFQANTYTTNGQARPSAAMDAAGDFVVVWQSNPQPSPAPPSTGQDGHSSGVFAQRFTSAGSPVGGEFGVNTYTTGPQERPRAAVHPSGGFVVVWHGSGAGDGYFGIHAQRYDASGMPIGGEFQLNSYTTGGQAYPDLAFDGAGNFVVAWISPQDGGSGFYGNYGIFARRFDSAGSPLGAEFQVNEFTTSYQGLPGVAALPGGGFVVVWASAYGGDTGPDGSNSSISARLFDGAGSPTTSEFVVNTTTSYYQYRPAVASDGAGNFVVVWNGYGSSDPSYGVFGQRFTSTGAPIGGEFLVNTYTTGNQIRPRVAAAAAGNFIVAWDSSGGDDSGRTVFAQRYDSAGSANGDEFQVNAYVTGHQQLPTVAINAAGDAVFAWQSGPLLQPFQPSPPPGQDGDRDGIFGQVCPSTDTTAPSVRVANPTASVKLYQSFDYTIRWEAADNCGLSFFDVFYSLDGGGSFTPLCTGLSGRDRSCLWPSPLPLTSTGRVRVEAHDSSGNTSFDTSDANFQVLVGTPAVTVKAPNLSGIIWTAGTTQTIKWNHNLGQGEPVTLEVSRDNGSTWQLIEIVPTSAATQGLYNWFVTGPGTTTSGAPAARALVRVRWTANTSVQDQSNAAFTILPRTRVAQPNAAVTWVVGSVQTIKWRHNYGANQTFGIELNRNFLANPNGPWELIALDLVGAATGGSFSWTVTGPPTTSARIRVFKRGDRRNSTDTSDVDFTISP